MIEDWILAFCVPWWGTIVSKRKLVFSVILAFPTDNKERCLIDLLTHKPHIVMARPPDIDGRDGGGAPEGLTEQNLLVEVPHYRPSIYLLLIRFVLVAIAVLAVSGVFCLLVCRRGQSEGRPQSWAADQLVPGIQLHCEGVEISGYPFVSDYLTKPQLSLSITPASSDRREWRWQSSQIIAEMRPWDLSNMKLDVSGSNYIEFKRGTVRDVYRAATPAIPHFGDYWGRWAAEYIVVDSGRPRGAG